jgi:4-hydroxybenzoate polyprenyltransferase
MLGSLFAANLSLSAAIGGVRPSVSLVCVLFCLQVLFFFHLRLFDEIKDYKTDCEINRTRPLPRGLIPMREFKTVLWSILGFEVLLGATASIFQSNILLLLSLLLALGYSILMYREFFIGDWLRPKMEAYAISHTFVSGLFAAFLMLSLAAENFYVNRKDLLLLMTMNWMIFNVFEFARKTFSKEEERPSVESYSLRLSPLGAVLITLIFVIFAFICLSELLTHTLYGRTTLIGVAIISGLVAAAGFFYATTNSTFSAKVFRGVSSAYLILFNLCVALGFWFS